MSKSSIPELYHYTNLQSYLNIVRIGKILTSPSCLYEPKNITKVHNPVTGSMEFVDLEHDHIKRVVWLTESKKSSGHGLALKPFNLRITVKPNDSTVWWMKWQMDNHMEKKWFRHFTKGFDYRSWWVSEKEIPVSDILLVEDINTGEVLYSCK